MNGKIKQVVVLRRDLKMGAGKASAQAAHASLGCLIGPELLQTGYAISFNQLVKDWINSGQKKVCLRVNSEEELLKLEIEVRENTKIPYSIIQDSGKTKFHGVPTYTAIGIGPGYEDDIDKLTKHLKLY